MRENMINKKATFILSAATIRDFPSPSGKEYAIMGRSNVGKSSFVNHVLANHNLARVSRKPGKTVLANFYKLDDIMTWVDLPGYGYARTSWKEKDRCSRLINDYCQNRENLCGIIWLLDIRHVGIKADREAYTWFSTLNLPLFPVMTKCDKLTVNKQKNQVKEFISFFRFTPPVVTYSINQESSRTHFWDTFSLWSHNI